MSTKVFEIVTERVTTLLQNGTVPWRKPWNSANSKPMNITGRAYNGINFFLLSCLGFANPVYLTFNQIKSMGGRIKAGEEKKHAPVFFWKWIEYKKDQAGNDNERTVPICRYSLVWNIEQVEGIELPAKIVAMQTATALVEHGNMDAAEAIVNGYQNGPNIVSGLSDRACYRPMSDTVNMPEKGQFPNLNEYYSTLFHELGHSTGHLKRLNRKELMDVTAFGSHDYSVEELCAEMTAAYLCAASGIDNTLENSAAYIASWLKCLKNDPRMLMTAAARAQKAFKHIVGDVAEESTED